MLLALSVNILCTILSEHVFATGFTGNHNRLCNSGLPRTQSSFIYKGFKNIMYMSLCKPLRDLPKEYFSGLQNGELENVKIIILRKAKDSLHLLASSSGDFTYEEDYHEVKLGLDLPCTEFPSNRLNYSVVISFKCSQEENEPIFEDFRRESCSFIFKWLSPFACVLLLQDRSDSCLLMFPKKSFDLSSLAHPSHYAIQQSDYKVYVNFCGPVNLQDCQSSGAVISGCIIHKNKTYLLENNLCRKAFLEERSRIEVEYCMIEGMKVSILFQCKRDAFAVQPVMRYSKKRRRLNIIIETSVVCLNDDRCDINYGDERYSLPRASNVMIKETTATFLLSACGPLKPDHFWVGGVASASLINETVMSLGSKRSLERNDKGGLILTLTEGSFCPGTNDRAKTVIKFICSNEETGPVFLHKSDKCVFSFQWKGSSYCPVLEATGRGCDVRDPNYGITYHLEDGSDDSVGANSHNEFVISHKNISFRLNLCGKVNTSCDSDMDAIVCLLANNKEIVLGRRSSQTYSFKQGSLVFELWGSECAPNVTSHVIVNVVCEFGASDRFVPVLNESDSSCVFNFVWYTRKRCPKGEPIPCIVKNQKGSVVNLNPLRLSSNYRVPMDNESYFLLNVCGPLWYGSHETCLPSSAACLVNKGNDFQSIGEVYNNLIVTDQDEVILVYKNVNVLPPWETVITFICGERNEGPQYTGRNDWKHSFMWKTNLACFNKTDGDRVKWEQVESTPKQIVVSEAEMVLNESVSKGVSDREVENTNSTHKSRGEEEEEEEVSSSVSCVTSGQENSIDLSVLEPVYVNFSSCVRLYVDVCKKASCLSSDSRLGLNLRSSRPIVNDRGFVTVNYYDDAVCGDHSTRSVSFIFVCDKSQGKGSPRLENQTSCSYTFLWNTSVVCPNDVLVLDKSNGGIIKRSGNEVAAFESFLKNPFQIERESESFYVNLLSSNVPGDEGPCSGNICEKKNNNTWISHGILKNFISYDYNYNRIVMELDGGDLCNGTRRYSSKIYLNCSKNGTSHPTSGDWVVSRDYCEVILELVTPCFDVKPINEYRVIIFLAVSGVLLVLCLMGFALYYTQRKRRRLSSCSEMRLILKEHQKVF